MNQGRAAAVGACRDGPWLSNKLWQAPVPPVSTPSTPLATRTSSRPPCWDPATSHAARLRGAMPAATHLCHGVSVTRGSAWAAVSPGMWG